VKAEGISKHKLSQLKTRWAGLKQNLEQIQITSGQQDQRKEKELEWRKRKARSRSSPELSDHLLVSLFPRGKGAFWCKALPDVIFLAGSF